MEGFITPQDMEVVYDVTDALGIDREIVRVELEKEDPGQVKQGFEQFGRGEVFEITLPAGGALEEWMPTMREELEKLLGR